MSNKSVLAAVFVGALTAAGCGPPVPVNEPTPVFAVSEPPADFRFETTDGSVLTGESLRGRYSVIAFVATYDLISQAQIKVLGLVAQSHVPRVNVAAVILEPRENKPIAEAYAKSLNAAFPIGVADLGTVRAGPFGAMRHVPTVVILDRDGRIVLRHTGPLEEPALHSELTKAGARR
ncbi:MAG: TlpA family protein disulfide reductase [Polyangiaceae bacterium]|nr:TlpA family protein disulfide reductase [Polyangiaceae bacterium]